MRVLFGCLLCCLLCRHADGRIVKLPVAPPALSLKQAVAQALQNNPSITRLNETRLAAKALEREEAGGILPHLTLEGVEKDGPSGAPGFGFTGLVNSTITSHSGISIVLSQIIYDFGRTLHRIRSRRFTASAIGADEQAQSAYIVLSVYQNYYKTLLAKKQVQLAEQNVSARELTVKQAQTRFDSGLTSRVDVGLAKSALAEAEVELVNDQNAVQQDFADLNAAMGVPPSTQTYALDDYSSDTALDITLPTTLEEDIASALKQRAEMQSVDAQIHAAEEKMGAAKAGRLPVLSGLASAGYLNVTPGQFGNNHEYAIGLGITFPLYTGGQKEAGVAGAHHQIEALWAAREEQAQNIRLQVVRARLMMASLAQSRRAIKEQLDQAQDSFHLAAERYQQGLGNFLELQQAQLALLTAQTSAVRLRYETVIAHATLRYALGTLIPAVPGLQKK